MIKKMLSILLTGTLVFTIGGCYSTPSKLEHNNFKEEKVSISVDDISYFPIAGEYQSIQVVTFNKQELQDYKVIDNEDGSKDVILHINESEDK